MGGASRCNGTVEMKFQGEWRPVTEVYWTQKDAALICKELDCGSAVLTDTHTNYEMSKWWLESSCLHYGSVLRDCLMPSAGTEMFSVTCSGKPIYDVISGGDFNAHVGNDRGTACPD